MALRFGKKSDPSPTDAPPSGTPAASVESPPPFDVPSGFAPTDFVVQNTTPDPTSPPPPETDFGFGDFAQDAQNTVPPAPVYGTAPPAPPAYSPTPGETLPLIPPSAFNTPSVEPDETMSAPLRRKLPILPLALAAFLIIGGGIAALLFMKSQQNSEQDETPSSLPPRSALAARPTTANVPASTVAASPTTAAHMVPTKVAPTKAIQNAPTGQPSHVAASPTTASTHTAGSPPHTTTPSADLKSLKALWQQGADAKHRGDLDGARKAWGSILAVSPNHPGIRDALAKLSSASGTKQTQPMNTMKR